MPAKEGLKFTGTVWILLSGAVLPWITGWTPQPIASDNTVFMPGSQPGSLNSGFQSAESKCANCHSGYDPAVEPSHLWRGSMMAHATRDPLWLACLVVAEQDAIWATGTPNAGDLCIRCHTPGGWLGGRSDPVNLTALDAGLNDFEGVNCDACHRLVDPFTVLGQLPWVGEETEAAAVTAAETTTTRDWNTVLQGIRHFDGSPFYDQADRLPWSYGAGSWPNYTEAVSGQFYVDPDTDKRGNRYDAEPKSHGVYYSRFHKSKMLCSTCHDVSNPVLANLGAPGTSESQSAGSYFHVERTWSEFQLSAFSQPGGAPTDAEFREHTGVARAEKCQDCHMRDATGQACNKTTVPVREDLATHDLSGGNTWITRLLASADQSSTVYNAYNYAILSGQKYSGAGIEINGLQGLGPALLDGEARARENLRNAAALEKVIDHAYSATIRIRNLTGHKLISGFPEGRRMWLQVEFMDAQGNIIDALNEYQPLVTSLDGEGNRQYESGGVLEKDREDLVYEAKMESSLTGENQTFHFVLATDRYKDNRIPPKGFDYANAHLRKSQPRWNGADALNYFTASEYAGGYDDISFSKPAGTAGWRARLYYQTTSREYIEFLRDEANGTAASLSSPTPSGEAEAYIIQDDPFFSTLKDWGRAIYDLWLNNGGSPPELMEELVSLPQNSEVTWQSGTVRIRFHTMPGRTYQVEYSDTLESESWTHLGSPLQGDGTMHVVTDTSPLSAGSRFYRIESEVTE